MLSFPPAENFHERSLRRQQSRPRKLGAGAGSRRNQRLFDYLVGATTQRQPDSDAEHLGGLDVDVVLRDKRFMQKDTTLTRWVVVESAKNGVP